MIPTTSSIDSSIVDLGDLTEKYGITQNAIPFDVGDSAGSVPTFNTGHAVTHEDSVHAIGQQLTLTTPDEGKFVGNVVSVGTPAPNVMNLSAETFLSNLTVEKRTYPIYRSLSIPQHTVSAAVDHWTQEAGLFYDKVPGNVITYHSFYGHDYVYSHNTALRVRAQLANAVGAANLSYKQVGQRVGLQMVPGSKGSIAATGADKDASNPTPVPAKDSGKALVISFGVYIDGDHNTRLTWNFLSASKQHANPLAQGVIIEWWKESGFGVYTTRVGDGPTQIAAPTGELTTGHYHVSVALWEDGPAHTRFTVRVREEATGRIHKVSTNFPTPLRGTQMQLNDVSMNVQAQELGAGDPCVLYGYAISTMTRDEFDCWVPTARKSLGQTRNDVSIVPGFNGDVWNNVKTLLSLHRMDLWYEDDVMHTALRETAIRTIAEITRPSITVNQRESARFVEVVNQRMTAHSGVPTVLHKADSVHQVATGEVETINVQTEHSIDTVSDPVCVSGITPYPYLRGPGQYVITGSDGYIVSPAWWKDNGGKITARTTEKEGEIEITIKGPDYDSVRSPYRVSEGDAGRPALYITGTGILGNPITLKVPTGNPTAVTEIGETVDIPFITGELLAYDAAVQVAQKYAAPDISLSATEAKLAGTPGVLSKRGIGALIQYKGNVYRVGTVSHGRATNTASNASPYNTIGQVNAFAGTRTIGAGNIARGGRSIKDVALRPLAAVNNG